MKLKLFFELTTTVLVILLNVHWIQSSPNYSSQEADEASDILDDDMDFGDKTEGIPINNTLNTDEDDLFPPNSIPYDPDNFENAAVSNTSLDSLNKDENDQFEATEFKSSVPKLDNPDRTSLPSYCLESRWNPLWIMDEVSALRLANTKVNTEIILLKRFISTSLRNIYTKISNMEKRFVISQSHFESEKSHTYARFIQAQLDLEDETINRIIDSDSLRNDLTRLEDLVKFNKDQTDQDIAERKKATEKVDKKVNKNSNNVQKMAVAFAPMGADPQFPMPTAIQFLVELLQEVAETAAELAKQALDEKLKAMNGTVTNDMVPNATVTNPSEINGTETKNNDNDIKPWSAFNEGGKISVNVTDVPEVIDLPSSPTKVLDSLKPPLVDYKNTDLFPKDVGVNVLGTNLTNILPQGEGVQTKEKLQNFQSLVGGFLTTRGAKPRGGGG